MYLKRHHIVYFWLLFIFTFTVYHLRYPVKHHYNYHNYEGGHPVILDPLYFPRDTNVTRRWPPLDYRELYDPKTGFFELTLKPSVNKTVDSQEGVYDEAYREIIDAIIPGSLPTETNFDSLVRKDEALRIDPEVHNIDLYPQSINLQFVVKSIREGRAIKHEPAHDIEQHVRNLPKNVCDYSRKLDNSSYPLELVVIIKTCVVCFGRRQLIRNTFANPQLWNEFNVSFVFVVGLLDKTAKTGYLPHEVHNSNQQAAAESLFVDEMDTHNDILVGSFEDSYYKLHNKLVFSFRWASAFCTNSTPLFLFMDDDVTIVPRALIPLIRRIPQRSQRFLIAGLFNRTKDVQRPTSIPFRWALSSAEYPYQHFPPYHLGFAYFVGAEMVNNAAIAMAFVKPIRVDDLYLGIVWNKLHYPLIGINEFSYLGKPTDKNETIAVGFADNMMSMIDWSGTCLPDVARKQNQVCAIYRP